MSYYNGYRYTFTWEQGRQLDSLTYNGHTTSYQYDYNGIRTRKTKSDGSYVIYDIVDGTAVGETHYNSAGTATMYMMYIHDENGAVNGIGLWYPSVNAWAYYYFVKNLQGDVLEVYNEDHSCVASYSYDSWGNILSKSGSLADINPFRYRGYYFDTESWFYYLQSRYYDPAIGRFINADVLTSTGQGILGNNMFAYCLNNPICTVDYSGLAAVSYYADHPEHIAYAYICDQEDRKIGLLSFGFSNVALSGCSAVASYNALLTLGAPCSLTDVLSFYNSNPIALNMGGYAGAGPKRVAQFFSSKGYTVKMTDNLDKIDIYSKTADASILYYQFPATYLGIGAYGAHFVEYHRQGNGYMGCNTAENNGSYRFGCASDYAYENSRYYAVGIYIYK